MSKSELQVCFLAEPSAPGVQPIFQCVMSMGPLDAAIRAAKGTLEKDTFPWAKQVEIKDGNGTMLHSWSVNA
jgi:hypothetical protein